MSSNQAGVYRGGNTTGTTGTTSGTTGTTGELRNTTGTAGTGVISAQRGEPVCDQKYYTKVANRRHLSSAAGYSLQRSKLTTVFVQVEDRPIVKEQVTYVREHHPMEKEFIVETRPTGRERELTEGRTSEVYKKQFNMMLTCSHTFVSGSFKLSLRRHVHVH